MKKINKSSTAMIVLICLVMSLLQGNICFAGEGINEVTFMISLSDFGNNYSCKLELKCKDSALSSGQDYDVGSTVLNNNLYVTYKNINWSKSDKFIAVITIANKILIGYFTQSDVNKTIPLKTDYVKLSLKLNGLPGNIKLQHELISLILEDGSIVSLTILDFGSWNNQAWTSYRSNEVNLPAGNYNIEFHLSTPNSYYVNYKLNNKLNEKNSVIELNKTDFSKFNIKMNSDLEFKIDELALLPKANYHTYPINYSSYENVYVGKQEYSYAHIGGSFKNCKAVYTKNLNITDNTFNVNCDTNYSYQLHSPPPTYVPTYAPKANIFFGLYDSYNNQVFLYHNKREYYVPKVKIYNDKSSYEGSDVTYYDLKLPDKIGTYTLEIKNVNSPIDINTLSRKINIGSISTPVTVTPINAPSRPASVQTPTLVIHPKSTELPIKISGTVLYPNGKPLADAVVMFNNDSKWTTNTDSNGYYDFTGVSSGSHLLSVKYGSYKEYSKYVTVPEDDVVFDPIYMHGYSITGYILYPHSQVPIPGAKVMLNNSPDWVAYTNSSGYFKINDTLPGTHTINVSFSGYKDYNGSITTINQDAPIGNIWLHGYRISGYVMDGNSPVSGASVYLNKGKKPYLTKSDGYYEFNEVITGTSHSVSVTKDGYLPSPVKLNVYVNGVDKDKQNISISQIKVNINGSNVKFNSTTGYPYINKDSRTMVPLRVTMEAFGAAVTWDSANNRACVAKNGTTIYIPIGKNNITVNGTEISNDTAAAITNGKTYCPIRKILESFGATVTWDGNTTTINVNYTVTNDNSWIELSEPTKIIQVEYGSQIYLEKKWRFSKDRILCSTLKPEWQTSDKSIAQIDSSGYIVAVSPGTTTVTATYNGNQYTATVDVITSLRDSWVNFVKSAKVGDVILCQGDCSDICGYKYADPYNHAALVYKVNVAGDNSSITVLHARGNKLGVGADLEEDNISYSTIRKCPYWNVDDCFDLYQVKNITDETAVKVVESAYQKYNNNFSFGLSGESKNEVYCSQLVVNAFKAYGIVLDDRKGWSDFYITPDVLAKSENLIYIKQHTIKP